MDEEIFDEEIVFDPDDIDADYAINDDRVSEDPDSDYDFAYSATDDRYDNGIPSWSAFA